MVLGGIVKKLLCAIAAIVVSAQAGAQTLVDHYAPLPQVWDAQVSPDGQKLALGCSMDGARALCVYDLTGQNPPRGIEVPGDSRVVGLFWGSNRYLISEITHFASVDTSSGQRDIRYHRLLSSNVETGATVMLLSQYGGNHTDLTNVTSILANDEEKLAIELSWVLNTDARSGTYIRSADDYASRVHEVDLATGNVDGWLRNEAGSVFDIVHDENGEEIVALRHDRETGNFEIRRLVGGRQDLYEARHEVDLPAVYGLIDGGTALAVFIPGGEGLVRLDLETGERTSFGENVSRAAAIIDRTNAELVGFGGMGRDFPVRGFIDEELESLQTALSDALPHSHVVLHSWSSDRQIMVAAAYDIGRPTTYYLYDRSAGQVSVVGVEYPGLEQREIPTRQNISYEARDGLSITAYLTLPPGASSDDGPFPLVLLPHGGPQARDTGLLDYQAAFIAELGYAVLQPNYRGSTGYGRDFIEAGHDQFASGMIEDMIDGARYLANEGIVQSDGYCAVGASYGGYAALMLPLADASNVRCSVAIAPVSAPRSIFHGVSGSRTITQYWERYIGSRFGQDDYWATISPIDRVGEYRSPVLLIHGEEDVVVPPYHSEQFAERAGPNVDLIMMEGENHYFDREASRRLLLQSISDFLGEHFPAE